MARARPDRVLIAGIEGIGKSSFAASAGKVAILSAEDGTDHIEADPRFDAHVLLTEDGGPIVDWQGALEALDWLATGEHDRETIVVDSIDWLEPLAWRYLCESRGWRDIEAPGYGKGYTAATEEWRRLIRALDAIRDRGLDVVLVAHSIVKPFSNPSGFDYHRHELALHKGAAALSKEWCDSVLFLHWEEIEAIRDGEQKRKGSSTGQRIAEAVRNAAWDAKSRWGLPDSFYLPDDPSLGFATYAGLRTLKVAATPAVAPRSPVSARVAEVMLLPAAEILELIGARLAEYPDGEKVDAIRAHVKKNSASVSVLAKCLDRLETLAAAAAEGSK